jgi:hypothetical protein
MCRTRRLLNPPPRRNRKVDALRGAFLDPMSFPLPDPVSPNAGFSRLQRALLASAWRVVEAADEVAGELFAGTDCADRRAQLVTVLIERNFRLLDIADASELRTAIRTAFLASKSGHFPPLKQDFSQ